MSILQKLNSLITKRDKKSLYFLLIFSIFISCIEVIGVSIVMPFISISTDFEQIHANEYLEYIYNIFSFERNIDFVVISGIFLFVFYILRSLINLYYQHRLATFANNKYYHLAFSLFNNYVGMDYKKFVNTNSSHLTKVIVSEAGYMTSFITSLLILISEVFVAMFIYLMLLYVNTELTLLLTLILLINGMILVMTVSKKIKKIGIEREKYQKKYFEIINNSLGNFKFIKLKSSEDLMLNKFKEASMGYVKSNIANQSLQYIPKYVLEAVGFGILIAVITIYIYINNSNIANHISIITMYVLALYRLLPSVNKILNGYNEIMFSKASLDVIHNELLYDIEEFGEDRIEFNYSLCLENILFKYIDEKVVLDNINLKITKGEKIAFVGESGSGKSTLVDIIMGLYKPVIGQIILDDTVLTNDNIKSFRKKIGYIPQDIYLFDGTIAENIAFGEKYNEDIINDVLAQVNLKEFIKTQKDGIYTQVGEGGTKLSGGQKQRIGIARALYSKPEILVLDEATSALDNETEGIIMREIYNIVKDKTLIIIAHRLSTIENCDKIYTISDGILIKREDNG